jgi:cytochrome P450
MKSLYMPFSRGSRGCLGKGLGMMQLKLTVAAILPKFDVRIAVEDGMKKEDMEMMDHFLVQPKGGRCLLNFVDV